MLYFDRYVSEKINGKVCKIMENKEYQRFQVFIPWPFESKPNKVLNNKKLTILRWKWLSDIFLANLKTWAPF